MGASAEIDVAQTEAYKTLSAEFESFKTTANSVAEAYATQVGELTAALDAAGELATTLQAALDESNSKLAAITETAEVARVTTRKEKIVAAVGEAKADALLAATTAMDDEQFNTLVAALGTQAVAESKTKMFTEVGASADVDVTKTAGKSAEMLMLENKYGAGNKP